MYDPPSSGVEVADTTVLSGASGKSAGKSAGSETGVKTAAVSASAGGASATLVVSDAADGSSGSDLPHPVASAKVKIMNANPEGVRMDGERTHGRAARQVPPEMWTVGHSTLDLEALAARLRAHGVRQVADVRRYPASRRNPQFNRETLSAFLEARGISYHWFEDLGGRRGGTPADSPNLGLESPGFRQYADYAGTDAFRDALEALIEWAGEGPTAILCAEALWWRCHRRLLADQLVARGGVVHHIADEGTSEPHQLWDLARQEGDRLVYPPEQGELGLGPPPKNR